MSAIPILDLHGMSLAEAEQAVAQFVDQLYFHDAGLGKIIHGLGVIADHLGPWLEAYPYVARWEREIGHAGATTVWVASQGS